MQINRHVQVSRCFNTAVQAQIRFLVGSKSSRRLHSPEGSAFRLADSE